MRIVRLANYVAPHSGGLRTSLRELGAGYLAAGHEPVLIIPGERDGDEQTAQGRVVTLSGPRIPRTGGYRALLRKQRVAALLSELRPDTLEVSDRTTLRWTGRWAREHGVPAAMISHESLTALTRMAVPGLDLPGLSRWGPALAVVDAVNRRTARTYQRVICTTAWAATEFERISAANLVRARLGVDLTTLGALAVDVEYVQLPAAAALKPDVASVVVGINDTLRGNFDPQRTSAAMARTVAGLRAAGAQVPTMRLPDPGQMFGLPRSLAKPLGRRMRAVNEAVDEIALRYDTLHLDAARDPAIYERRYWSVDRLHPNERGHRFVACQFHALLAAAGFPVGPGPDPEPSTPPPSRMAEIRWMATKGTMWLARRSRDLVPALAALAIRELLSADEDVTERELVPASENPST